MISSVRFVQVLCAVAAMLLMPSCVGAEGAKRLRSEDLRIVKRDGSQLKIKAEIAATDADRERGLMFRKSVPEGEGMLFVFDADQVLSFWMKNTEVPLSIAFLSSEGRIAEIHDMRALSLAPVNSERSVRFALEVPQGWFGRVGVSAGDAVADLARFLR